MVGLEVKLPLLLAAAVARTVGGAIPDLLLLHDGVTSPLWEVLHLCLGREELEELSDITWCSWGHCN